MRVGILTFEKFNGKKKDQIGSSRIRANWLMKNWEGDHQIEEFKIGVKYDAVIFQKAYWFEYLELFDGIKIFDICDADWLMWGCPVFRSIEACDAVVCSTVELAKFIGQMVDKEIWVIPDRMDLDEHSIKKIHRGVAERAVWFGYSQNFPTLDSAIPSLKKLGLGLNVISDQVFIPSGAAKEIEIRNLPYKWETSNRDILSGDIVLNPKFGFGYWKYKSNNKDLTAWALGMPVAHDEDELRVFLDPMERQKEAESRLREVAEKWNIKESVREYNELINVLRSKREKV